jgi:hypothetical protein
LQLTSLLALFLITRLGALRGEMVGISTVVTLGWDKDSIKLLPREIPLLTYT